MNEESQRQYFNPIPPVESATPGVGVTYLTATVTAANVDLSGYPGFFDRYLELIASGDKIWVTTSSDGAVAVDKSATGGTTLVGGTATKNGIPIANNGVLVVRLDKGANKFLHWQSDATNAILIVRPASQPTFDQM